VKVVRPASGLLMAADMGVSIHYWSIPPASSLYERLLTDQAFVTRGAELAGVIARQAPAGVDVDRLHAAWVLERERVGEAQIFGRQRPSHQPSKAFGFGVQS